MYKAALFLSLVSGISTFSIESGLRFSTVLACEDSVFQDERANILGNKKPKYTLQHATSKVKNILQTMQAREKDFAGVYENLINKFSDTKVLNKEKMDIVDPYWSGLIKRNKNDLNNLIPLEAKGNSVQAIRSQRLQALSYQKKCIEEKTVEEFKGQVQRSQNAVNGFQTLIDICERYEHTQNESVLSDLLDILLRSHLLNLYPTIETYMSSRENNLSHVSLKKEEIDIYYTQDSRLAALSQLYYIVDYVRPIDILIQAGLQPKAEHWDFSEKVQKYVKRELTLGDPSIFLIDGFLFQKGIEKSKTSVKLLEIFKKTNSGISTSGTLRKNIEFSLLSLTEKEKERTIYDELYKVYRIRVESYIKRFKQEKFENVQKSNEFFNGKLSLVSQYTAPPYSLEKEKKKPIKKGRNKKTTPIRIKEEKSNENFDVNIKKIIEPTDVEFMSPNLFQIPNECSDSKVKSTLHLQIIEDKRTLSKPTKSGTLVKQKDENRPIMSGKHIETLKSLLSKSHKPFTISYREALNAMSKVIIVELPPKKGGDFRKLVLYDSEKNIIGRVASYKPATSSLGIELMKIYRDFIKEQVEERKDLNLQTDLANF